MKLQILETSLNLRIEKGRRKEEYVLSKKVAEKQLLFKGTDIYTNVEFMNCQNKEYLDEFERYGYNEFYSLDKHGRGILCEVKNSYTVKKIHKMDDPHMLHLRIEQDGEFIDLITMRILVALSNTEDFKDRNDQWHRVLDYIANLQDTSHIVLIGDFNHGIIEDIDRYKNKPREHFNFQMVVSDLKKENIVLYHPMKGCSDKGDVRDHIAVGKNVHIKQVEYTPVFKEKGIGIPDHPCVIAEISTT